MLVGHRTENGLARCGAYHFEVDLANYLPADSTYLTPVVVWTGILLIYAFIASVLPVWLLLQPRDYINSLQLFVALGLLVIGLGVASVTGMADLSTEAVLLACHADEDEEDTARLVT